MAKNKDTKEFLELELDPEIMSEVEELAKQSKLTAFDMCLVLLRERISAVSESEPLESTFGQTRIG